MEEDQEKENKDFVEQQRNLTELNADGQKQEQPLGAEQYGFFNLDIIYCSSWIDWIEIS